METREKNSEMKNQENQKAGNDIPLPEVTFATFILSLNTSALVHLGEIPEPGQDETKCDLNLARHAIDTIAMLKEKTKGNLSKDEEALIDHILFDLRMKFVQKTG